MGDSLACSVHNAKGEWSMDNNTKVIYGMPPR
jgi:hypothetical protein